jgi:hypothetical protein
MKNILNIGILVLIIQGCNDTTFQENTPSISTQSSKPQTRQFSLDKALEDKDFEDFYVLMSRSTHNMYEYAKGNTGRLMYTNPKIESVAKLLGKFPDNALEQNYLFREGMMGIILTIPDFIIRRAQGTQEEKIALLEQLKNRGLSFDMYYDGSYPELVFYPEKDADLTSVIPYLDKLKNDAKDYPRKYDKIITFLANNRS